MKTEIFARVNSAISQSEAGESLKSTYRWSQFRTNNESNELWRQLFGATGVVFSHGEMFYHLMEWMIKKEGNFTNREAATLLYGTSVHDIGEAIIKGKGIGDKAAFYKTRSDEKKEIKIARIAIASLKLPKRLKTNLLKGYEQTVVGENPKLHFAFKALEKTEYVFTVMKVYQNNKKLKDKGLPQMTHLEPMIGRVLIFDLAKVLDLYAPKFPNSIGAALHSAEPLIDEMFEFSLPWLSKHNEWQGIQYDHKAIADSFRTKWESFKNSDLIPA